MEISKHREGLFVKIYNYYFALLYNNFPRQVVSLLLGNYIPVDAHKYKACRV